MPINRDIKLIPGMVIAYNEDRKDFTTIVQTGKVKELHPNSSYPEDANCINYSHGGWDLSETVYQNFNLVSSPYVEVKRARSRFDLICQ